MVRQLDEKVEKMLDDKMKPFLKVQPVAGQHTCSILTRLLVWTKGIGERPRHATVCDEIH